MTLMKAKSLMQSQISTPMPLAGHDESSNRWKCIVYISTPMPLAGHDELRGQRGMKVYNFYSHAPRGA